ncbi:MAG: farnesyl diphosphate synthase [Halanaerobium sp.]|nr:farnesyl diphosphate synthase [Halanaerobium sp.]
MDLRQELAWRKELIDEYLSKYFQQLEAPALIKEAMAYSIEAGGKRLRPILVMEGSVLVGGDPRDVLPVGAALEMIHTYSLIHDDLPCMDDDDLRRGKPTSHKVYGEAMATLAGDALLTQAFHLLAEFSRQEPQIGLEIIAEVARAAGAAGMVGGQVLDITSEGKEIGLEELRRLHRLKTGALFRASLRSGALAAAANPEELEGITLFAEAFGLLFQITDDLLDVIGDSEKMGKVAGRDEELQKATYPGLLGLEQAKDMADVVLADALRALEPFGSRAEFLGELANYVRQRET